MKETPKVIAYKHNEQMVSAFREYAGRHQEVCLCWQGCQLYRPDNEALNCKLEQRFSELNKELHILTGVLECPFYVPPENHVWKVRYSKGIREIHGKYKPLLNGDSLSFVYGEEIGALFGLDWHSYELVVKE